MVTSQWTPIVHPFHQLSDLKQVVATGRADKQRLDRFSKQLVSKMIIALIILKINIFYFLIK